MPSVYLKTEVTPYANQPAYAMMNMHNLVFLSLKEHNMEKAFILRNQQLDT